MKASIFGNAVTDLADQHPQHIMNSWIKSVEEFYVLFDQLARYATTFATAGETKNYIGQCPRGQVFQLLSTMKRQFVHLLDDMDQSSGLSKLVANTVLLKTLSAQATLSIQLINLSAS